MMKTVVLATFGLACFTASQIPSDAREYYPTHPGDTWTYESSIRGQFTNEVADSVVREGDVIFRIRSTDSSGREQMLAVRHDGPRLYLGPDVESLGLISNFDLEAGASSVTRMGTQAATLTLVDRYDSLDVFGNRFHDVIKVHIAPGPARGVTYFFAREIGMVGMESDHPRSRVRLIRATVGGRTIGAASP